MWVLFLRVSNLSAGQGAPRELSPDHLFAAAPAIDDQQDGQVREVFDDLLQHVHRQVRRAGVRRVPPATGSGVSTRESATRVTATGETESGDASLGGLEDRV